MVAIRRMARPRSRRIVRGFFALEAVGLWRFAADRDFREVIGPRFSWGWPFHNGIAIACVDCSLEEPDADGHREVTGGRWGAVDRSGEAVVHFTHTSHADVVQAIGELSQGR